jgi:hypothetical protein
MSDKLVLRWKLIIHRNAPDLVAEDLKHEHTNTRYDISGGHAYSGGQYVPHAHLLSPLPPT